MVGIKVKKMIFWRLMKNGKLLKPFLWVFSCVIAFLLIILAFLPTWLSSPSGTQIALRWINSRLDGKLSIERMELSWFGGQRFDNLLFEDAQSAPIFSFRSFETDTSLLYLLFGGRSFGDTSLQDPYLHLAQETEETPEKGKKERRKGERWGHREWKLPTFEDSLVIHNGKVVFLTKNLTALTVFDLEVNKEADLDTLTVQAKTQQGDKEGSVNIKASFADKFQAVTHIQDFPIAILDALDNSSLFTEALGPSLNADFNIEREKGESLTVSGSAKSAQLTAYIDGKSEQGTFTLSPQTHLELTLTPALFKHLIHASQRGNWDLASPTTVEITVQKGVFPLSSKKIDFQDVVLQAQASINRAELHHATVGSYSLKQFDLSVTALHNIELSYQGEIQGKEATKLAGHLSITPEGKLLFESTTLGFPVTLLELVSPQLEKNVRTLFGGQFDVHSAGTFMDNTLESQFSMASSVLQVKGSLNGPLPNLHVEANGSYTLKGEKAKVLGTSVFFAMDGTSFLDKKGFALPFVKGKLFNSAFEIDFRGRVGQEGKPLSPDQIQLIATGLLKKLPMEENEASPALENATLFVQVDGSKNMISGKVEAEKANLDFEVQKFIHEGSVNFDHSEIQFSSNLTDFPLAVIDPFVSDTFHLTDLLGKTLTLQAHGTYTPQMEPLLKLDVQAKSEGFSAALALSLDHDMAISQDKPSSIYWQMTPRRYEALMQGLRLNPEYEPVFTLMHPTEVELKISQFTCPASSPKDVSEFLCQSGFIGKIHLGPATFRSKHSNEAILFQGIQGEITGEDFSEAIRLNLAGDILATAVPKSEKSAFSFKGEMLHFWTKSGHLNRQGLALKGELNLDLLPVHPIMGILPLDPETREITAAVLGDLVNAHIYGEISQLSGPLTIDIKASNFKTTLPLQLTPHAIYLREPIDAELTLTEAVSETLLKDVAPLLIAGASSDHPIKVYIEPQGFMIPIKPYSLQGVKIGKAVIDIGKIRVRNGGHVQALMEFLNAQEVTPDGWMEAWFTPIIMQLQGGVASYQRFDALLASRVHIALWGGINLIDGQVRMTLGIAPSTLAQRFKIKGLSKENFFQVKMTGTTSHLELDWSAATRRITLLVAKTKLGGLIGGILEQLLPTFGEEPVPPPAAPLPWENFYPS